MRTNRISSARNESRDPAGPARPIAVNRSSSANRPASIIRRAVDDWGKSTPARTRTRTTEAGPARADGTSASANAGKDTHAGGEAPPPGAPARGSGAAELRLRL